MSEVTGFRPEGWSDIKEGVLKELQEKVGDDKEALEVAEGIYELAGYAMLRLIRQTCCVNAVCADGQVAVLTGPVSQLSTPGRPGVPAAMTIPLSYRKREKWSGRGMVGFIPDDNQLVAGRR